MYFERFYIRWFFLPLFFACTATADESPKTQLVSMVQNSQTNHQQVDYDSLRQLNATLDSEVEVTTARQQMAGGWWRELVTRPLRSTDSMPLDLQNLLVRTLEHSKQIKVFSELPMIRETAIGEADASFDWYGFLDTRWDDVSEPVGNSLTVGGNGRRFNDHDWSGTTGLRRKTTTGAQLELSQRVGWQDNNSTFFIPDPQGTSRLTLGFTQPLLRGRGRLYNTSLTVLAQIDKTVADDEFSPSTRITLIGGRACVLVALPRTRSATAKVGVISTCCKNN